MNRQLIDNSPNRTFIKHHVAAAVCSYLNSLQRFKPDCEEIKSLLLMVVQVV